MLLIVSNWFSSVGNHLDFWYIVGGWSNGPLPLINDMSIGTKMSLVNVEPEYKAGLCSTHIYDLRNVVSFLTC